MSLFSLCLTYTLICQTRLTAPDPGRISQQARQHAGRTIFSHPKSRHRPMQSSTLICLPLCFSLHRSLSHFLCPSLNSPSSISVTFPLSPTAFIHICPRSASLESFLLYHCRAPRCFSPPHVSLLPTETPLPCACLSSFSSLSSV